jgi:hypothetical protein
LLPPQFITQNVAQHFLAEPRALSVLGFITFGNMTNKATLICIVSPKVAKGSKLLCCLRFGGKPGAILQQTLPM